MNVIKNTPAYKKEIKVGEELISINGNEIIDVLDYRFYQSSSVLNIVIKDNDNIERTIIISKGEYEDLGLEFETYLMDKQHSCRNKCIFCFIDQLPKGMRESLYFKDDDSRLSFLFGNYITLTNLTEHEINRIIKMHISPINISVHTTNPELRVKMMNNRFAGKTLDYIYRFAKAGIKINCQIVSCPGINDGDELIRTLTDLTKLYPSVECVAIVPVGLTRYREGLYPLTEYTKETASQTLDIIEKFGDMCVEKYGNRIVYASDEFYLKAEREFHSADYYGEFEQLDNGVGIIPLLKDEFDFALTDDTLYLDKPRSFTIACGVSVEDTMKKLVKSATKQFPLLKGKVIGIKNDFFGGGINVSGLVTGRDLTTQLKNIDLGDELLIPSVMLRREGDIFLDDVSLDEAEKELNIKITPVDNNGELLLRKMLGSDI